MKNKPYLQSITTLATGSFLAQIVVIIAAPLLTRLYTPAELGLYTYLISLSSIFMPIVNGKYDMAIVAEKDDNKIFPIIKLSLLVGLVVSVATVLFFLAVNYLLFFEPKQYSFFFFLFLILLSYALINVLTSYNNRMKEYKIMSSVYIIRTFCQNIGGVLFGLMFNLGSFGLNLSYVIGQFFGIKRQGKTLFGKINRIKQVSRSEIRDVAIKYKNQPLYSAPAAMANSFSYSSITLFTEMLYGLTTVGFYSISTRLLGLPLNIISGNVSKIFFESASREYEQTNQFFSSFKKAFLFQLLLSVPMVLLMILFAPGVCRFVFGDGWEVAGEYVVLLAPMFGIRFIVTTLTPAMIIVNKQSKELVLQLLFAFFSVVCFLLSQYTGFSVHTYLTIISILFSIVYISYLLVLYRYSLGNTK